MQFKRMTCTIAHVKDQEGGLQYREQVGGYQRRRVTLS